MILTVESDAERYAWLIAYELNEAKVALSPIDKAEHLEWARRFSVIQAKLKQADL
jgi:hypothetical protein